MFVNKHVSKRTLLRQWNEQHANDNIPVIPQAANDNEPNYRLLIAMLGA